MKKLFLLLITMCCALYNPQNEMFVGNKTKRNFPQNEMFFFSSPPYLYAIITHGRHITQKSKNMPPVT